MKEPPLYKQIQQEIKRQIAVGRLREGDRIPSESEIMKEYFVSAITAKNALYGLVDEGIIYRVKGKGSFVAPSPFPADHPLNTLHVGDKRRAKKRTIGVILPGCGHGIESEILNAIDTICQREGVDYYVRFTQDRAEVEIELIRQFIDAGTQGLILFPVLSEMSNAAVRQLLAGRFPFVFIDRYLTDTPAPSVTADNVGGAIAATNYLMDRCGEHIALMYKFEDNTAVVERVEGFATAMLERGYSLTNDKLCKLPVAPHGQEPVELTYRKVYDFLKGRPEVKGALATNIEAARCAYHALHALNRAPGEDFHLVSFDNPMLRGVPFIHQNIDGMVQKALDLLEEQIEGTINLNRHYIKTQFVSVPRENLPMDVLVRLVTIGSFDW